MFDLLRHKIVFFSLLLINIPITAQFSQPDKVCIGLTKQYGVDVNSVLGSTYTWKVDGVIQTESVSNKINFTWNTVGTHLVEVQELSAGGCLGSIKSEQVIVSLIPVVVTSGNSPDCEELPIFLKAQTNSVGGDFVWLGPNEYTSLNQNPEISSARIINSGLYSVSVSVDGCVSNTSSVEVTVNSCVKDFFIPEGFSPNGDGINDLFVIRGIEYYPDNTFEIFNRWGEKVFTTEHYKSLWNGKTTLGLRVGGDDLPISTYFYILNLGEGIPVHKGTIYLNR